MDAAQRIPQHPEGDPGTAVSVGQERDLPCKCQLLERKKRKHGKMCILKKEIFLFVHLIMSMSDFDDSKEDKNPKPRLTVTIVNSTG